MFTLPWFLRALRSWLGSRPARLLVRTTDPMVLLTPLTPSSSSLSLKRGHVEQLKTNDVVDDVVDDVADDVVDDGVDDGVSSMDVVDVDVKVKKKSTDWPRKSTRTASQSQACLAGRHWHRQPSMSLAGDNVPLPGSVAISRALENLILFNLIFFFFFVNQFTFQNQFGLLSYRSFKSRTWITFFYGIFFYYSLTF